MQLGWRRVGAYALCLDDDRVLLTRFSFPGHPDDGRWTLPGGGMEWLEAPEDTVERELLEETGLTASFGGILGVFSRWFTAQESFRRTSGHFVALLFPATELRGQLRTEFSGLDTTDDARWFRTGELEGIPHVELVDSRWSCLPEAREQRTAGRRVPDPHLVIRRASP